MSTFIDYGYISILPLAFEYSAIIFLSSHVHVLKLFVDIYISAVLQYKVCPLILFDVVISEQQKYVICIYVLVNIGM